MTRRLLLKELRENAPWAGIAFAVGMVVIFLARSPDLIGGLGRSLLPGYYGSGMIQGGTLVLPLLWSTSMMAWFCVAWGIALGLAQNLTEQGRATYQVLVTLPVRRSQVFAAKAGAGVLLYLVSVGVPYALLVLRVATPGHYPSPFMWWMLGPGLAAIAGGLAAYGGAFMAAARQARWYASRGAPLVAAVGICYVSRNWGLIGVADALVAAVVLLWGAAVSLESRDF